MRWCPASAMKMRPPGSSTSTSLGNERKVEATAASSASGIGVVSISPRALNSS